MSHRLERRVQDAKRDILRREGLDGAQHAEQQLLLPHLLPRRRDLRGERADDLQRGAFDRGVVVAEALGQLGDAVLAEEEQPRGRRALDECVERAAAGEQHLLVDVGEAAEQRLERLRAAHVHQQVRRLVRRAQPPRDDAERLDHLVGVVVVEADVLERVEEPVVQRVQTAQLDARLALGLGAGRQQLRHDVLHLLVLELRVKEKEERRLVDHCIMLRRDGDPSRGGGGRGEAGVGAVHRAEERFESARLVQHHLRRGGAPDECGCREQHLLCDEAEGRLSRGRREHSASGEQWDHIDQRAKHSLLREELLH
mmetsp:Transcript_35004/g.85076  ORF Transcript_35004/g.85076 Transcript_35004/m.85076 type:complete len:312 (-) Transcript_35004:613-1548(-)